MNSLSGPDHTTITVKASDILFCFATQHTVNTLFCQDSIAFAMSVVHMPVPFIVLLLIYTNVHLHFTTKTKN